jgi:hypothetical protein
MNYLILQYDNRKLNKEVKRFVTINKTYCEKYKYDYLFVKKHYDLPPYWVKVYLLYELLKSNKYKGILWLDMDACVHNPTIRIEDMLVENKHFYKSPDNKIWTSPFCAGVFFVLNSDNGIRIMQDWKESYNKKDWHKVENKWVAKCKWAGSCYEQGSFIENILPKYKQDIHTFHWRFFQSFYSNLKEKYEQCVFIVHFARKFKREIPDYLKSKKQNRKCVFLTRKIKRIRFK